MFLSTLEHRNLSVPDPRSAPHLSEDAVIEILKRLHVKSLLKFRCVSKNWLALISSLEFAKAHHSFQSQIENKLMIFGIHNGGNGNLSLYSILHSKSSTYSMSYDRSLDTPEGALRFLGTCNELMCFRTGMRKIIVWNPSTGKLKRIPDVWRSEHICLYGFGFDIENNDFKIVYAFQGKMGEMNDGLVYSFKSGVWESIKVGFCSGFTFPYIVVYVSGSLNWCDNSMLDDNLKWVIISFDLATHTSNVMALPNYEMGGSVHISESRGLLFASCLYKGEMKVWVMKEYGIEESWTSSVTVPNLLQRSVLAGMEEGNSKITVSNAVSIAFIFEDVDLLMRVENRLCLYRSETQTCLNLEMPEPYNVHSNFNSYVETLISPCLLDDAV